MLLFALLASLGNAYSAVTLTEERKRLPIFVSFRFKQVHSLEQHQIRCFLNSVSECKLCSVCPDEILAHSATCHFPFVK